MQPPTTAEPGGKPAPHPKTHQARNNTDLTGERLLPPIRAGQLDARSGDQRVRQVQRRKVGLDPTHAKRLMSHWRHRPRRRIRPTPTRHPSTASHPCEANSHQETPPAMGNDSAVFNRPKPRNIQPALTLENVTRAQATTVAGHKAPSPPPPTLIPHRTGGITSTDPPPGQMRFLFRNHMNWKINRPETIRMQSITSTTNT